MKEGKMELYSYNEAQTEAAALQKKIEKGRAKDCPEAEEKMEAGYSGTINKILKELNRSDVNFNEKWNEIEEIMKRDEFPEAKLKNNETIQNRIKSAAGIAIESNIRRCTLLDADMESVIQTVNELKERVGLDEKTFQIDVVLGMKDLKNKKDGDKIIKELIDRLNIHGQVLERL